MSDLQIFSNTALLPELAARVQALEAERLRPVPPPPPRSLVISPEVLAELCDAIADDDEFDEPEAGKTA